MNCAWRLPKENDVEEITNQVNHQNNGNDGDFPVKIPYALAIRRIHLHQQLVYDNESDQQKQRPYHSPSPCSQPVPTGLVRVMQTAG